MFTPSPFKILTRRIARADIYSCDIFVWLTYANLITIILHYEFSVNKSFAQLHQKV